MHLPEATSGYPLGCSPQRSKEKRSTREGGFPCRSAGRCAPARSDYGAESVRADTLRAHPENAAAPAQYPSTERRYRPNVTSGCPKRSEGGFPVGTRTNTAFHAESKRNRASRTEPGMGQESTKEAPPPTSGDSASFVRAGSAEKLSLPRRTQPESAHARGRRQPDRG